ncbi:hypothetical protein E2F43_08095 [Seongchinamella unica]|uniref:LUD domain-containing protein n=1 Tax=Seongchinamella unica TaxID=2547392 RepID=A0A4R5LRK6_9GAMM|nr:LUD domain-containing protein [Seongchinamella unica]TDG13491.1 hypothetical protein E2F43_08095 [Seongchinamella unica]
MSSESRSRIMARVRHASLGQNAAAIEAQLDDFGVAPAAELPHDDTCVAFMINVLRNQGSIDVAPQRVDVVKAVGQYIYRHYRSHRLVAGNDPHLAAMPWRDGGVLPRFGEIEPGEPVALSYAQWGVAETGATIFLSGRNNPARNNLLPEHHLVVLDVNQLLPDLESLWQQLEPAITGAERPRALFCIAGPSSTADIEAQLVCGAHGPRAWHVILTGEVRQEQLDTALDVLSSKKNPGGS